MCCCNGLRRLVSKTPSATTIPCVHTRNSRPAQSPRQASLTISVSTISRSGRSTVAHTPPRTGSTSSFKTVACPNAISLPLLLASCAGEGGDSATEQTAVTPTITKAASPRSDLQGESSRGQGEGSGDEETGAEPQQERARSKLQRAKKGECPYLEPDS